MGGLHRGGGAGVEAVVTVPAVPQGCPKVRRILEIWASGQGVISVHCFQNTVPAEAYTREGCLVEALGERGRGGGEMVLPWPPPTAPGIGSATTPIPCIPLSHPMQESGGTQRGDAAHLGAHGDFGVPGLPAQGLDTIPQTPNLLREKLPGSGGWWWGAWGCLNSCGC